MEVLFFVLVLLVFAYLAYRFLPHPIGLVAAVVIGLLALWLLIGAVGELDSGNGALDGGDRGD